MPPYQRKKGAKPPIRSLDADPAVPPPPQHPDASELSSAEKRAAIAEMVDGRASEHDAYLLSLRRAPRGRIGFTQIPLPIIEQFKDRCAALGMDQKEYFYHLLRQDGLSVPEYKELDARNRIG